jgi:hypothetical protein
MSTALVPRGFCPCSCYEGLEAASRTHRECSAASDGGKRHRISRGTAGTRSLTTRVLLVASTRPARRSWGSCLGSRTPSPFSAARTRRSSSAMASEPRAATQNRRTYGWAVGKPPVPLTNSTGTIGRIRTVAGTETPPPDAARMTGGRALPLTEGVSVFIDTVLQRNTKYRQVTSGRARKESLFGRADP